MGHGHSLLELRERNLLDHIYLGSPDDRRKPPVPAREIFRAAETDGTKINL
jgi:hypothetical protein